MTRQTKMPVPGSSPPAARRKSGKNVANQSVAASGKDGEEDGSEEPTSWVEVGIRLAQVIRRVGNLKIAAAIAGVTDQQVSRWRDGTSKMSLLGAEALARAAGVSLDWLASGDVQNEEDAIAEAEILSARIARVRKEGDLDRVSRLERALDLTNQMRALYIQERRARSVLDHSLNQPTENTLHPIAGPERDHVTAAKLHHDIDDTFTLLPRYDVRAGAGASGAIISENVVDYLAFKTEWINQRLRRSPENLFLFEIMGDSMEPTFRDGDLVLADRSVSSIRDGAVYALGVDDTVIAKRLKRHPKGSVFVISDNPRYGSDELTRDEAAQLRVLGQVLWRAGIL